MLRCVSKIKSRSARIDGAARLACPPAICVLPQRLWSLGWAARQFGAICNVILGLDGAPKDMAINSGGHVSGAGWQIVKRTRMCWKDLLTRGRHTLFIWSRFSRRFPIQALLSAPPLHSPASHIWRKRTNCQDRQSDRCSSLSLSLGSWSSQSIAVHTKRRCCRCRCWSTLMPD